MGFDKGEKKPGCSALEPDYLLALRMGQPFESEEGGLRQTSEAFDHREAVDVMEGGSRGEWAEEKGENFQSL